MLRFRGFDGQSHLDILLFSHVLPLLPAGAASVFLLFVAN